MRDSCQTYLPSRCRGWGSESPGLFLVWQEQTGESDGSRPRTSRDPWPCILSPILNGIESVLCSIAFDAPDWRVEVKWWIPLLTSRGMLWEFILCPPEDFLSKHAWDKRLSVAKAEGEKPWSWKQALSVNFISLKDRMHSFRGNMGRGGESKPMCPKLLPLFCLSRSPWRQSSDLHRAVRIAPASEGANTFFSFPCGLLCLTDAFSPFEWL